MAQERVTITGDIIDDMKSEGNLSETAREDMLVGMIESTSELVQESCIVDGQFKEVIREKGSLMTQTWTELFSLMSQYEAELVTKSGEIDIREAKLKSEESRLNLSALKSSEPSSVIAVLQQDNVEKDEKIMTYMGEINSLEKELADLRKELQLKDFHIQTIEKELANKDTDIGGNEQRIKVLDQRISDLSAEIKNKDFVISQVSKQVRSMATPGAKSRSREKKRPLPVLVTPGSAKVLRTGDDSATAISLRVSPKKSLVASSSPKNDDALSSPEDSAEDDPKDTDYIFEGGAEAVDDDFDNREPEPSTSDDLVKVKMEPTEESGFEVSMAKYHREAEPDSPTMPLPYYPTAACRTLTGSPVVYPTDSKKTMSLVYPRGDLNSSPTMTPFAQQTLNTPSVKYNIPHQQCVTSTGVHTLERLPPTKRRKYSQKRCRVCYRQGRRRETTMYCPICPSNPGLCAGNCFEIYHTLSPADYEVKPSFLTPEDEAKSSALLVEHSHSLLEEIYGLKTESLDSTFNESASVDMDSSVRDSPSMNVSTE